MSEAEAQKILDVYMNDSKLLPELRFWIANQGVALQIMATNKVAVAAMLERMKEGRVP